LITDCNEVRVELFKLNYMSGEFVLNDKADAQECLNYILTQMHTWMQTCTTPPNAAQITVLEKPCGDDVNKKLEELAKVVRCDKNPCFVHQMSFLFHQQMQFCTCGRNTGVLSLDENLFCQLVNMAQMEQAYE